MNEENNGYKIFETLKSVGKLDRLIAGPVTFRLIGQATVTWDVGDLGDGAGETSAGITVAGAALGDFVLVAPPLDAIDLLFCGYVQAANTVEIRVQNEATANRNMASGDWRVVVFRIS